MANKYNAKDVEPKWIEYWQKKGIFKFNPRSKKKIYSIDTPPPTVSGKMHLGHAFSYAHIDFVARYKRMKGFELFFPFGTDDNGLPTKLLIEKQKKVKASMMDRKEFVKLCLDILEKELRPKYILDWKRIGMCCDFDLFYTTINEHCQKISQKSFIDLYKAGREYRAEAPAMYCPKCQTAISQVECEDKDVSSFFNDIIFKIGADNVLIATTRPELLPACVAVFYHPKDDRYKKYKGMKAKVPLFNFEVPILEDERADPEKGTGIVMCCTFGDSTDAEWQKAHKLPIKEAIGKDGKMTALAGDYSGFGIKEAREKIIEDLKSRGLLVAQEPIVHTVNVHERCGTPIEFIHSKQWFVKYLDLKSSMLKWGDALTWYPKHMKNRYDNWVKGLQWDWCISRQLPYGVPFPVWYCKDCDKVVVASIDSLPVDPLVDKVPLDKCSCGCSSFVPEKDIINTWATSSLTPQIAAALVPSLYDKLYPMSLRPQAHDIISFWLFNTVVKSQLHSKVNPWKDCVISGWALDPYGKKMSKSKGNVIEPQEMISNYSSDALRFWAASSKLGEDLAFQEKELVAGVKTVTKLFNAARFCFMHFGDYKEGKVELEVMDKWLLCKLNKVVKECGDSFESYEYFKTKLETEKFFWNVFCDNYLEIVKDRLYNPSERSVEGRKSAQYVLYHALLIQLKLFAPIMPFITEEIYQVYYKLKDSIHLETWPEFDKSLVDLTIEGVGNEFIRVLSFVRQEKSKLNKSLKEPVKVLHCSSLLKDVLEDLKAVTKAVEVRFSKELKVEF